jgi:hypothetical protein
MLCSNALEGSNEVGITVERGWCSDRMELPHASRRSREYWLQVDREQIMHWRSSGSKNVQTKCIIITGLGVSWVQPKRPYRATPCKNESVDRIGLVVNQDVMGGKKATDINIDPNISQCR